MILAAAALALSFDVPRTYRAETRVTYQTGASNHFVKVFNGEDDVEITNDSPYDGSTDTIWKEGKQYKLIGGRWYVRDQATEPILSDDNRTLTYLRMPKSSGDFTYPRTDRLSGTLSQLADATIDGVPCHVYRIEMRGTTTAETLWVGLKDHYVHRLEQLFNGMVDGRFVPATELTEFTRFNDRLAIAAPVSPTSADHCLLSYPTSAPPGLVQPQYPDSARGLGLGIVNVDIHVVLDHDGIVEQAAVLRSSGNSAIDGAALTAAKASHFPAPDFLCPGVSPAAQFRYTFNGAG